MLKKKELQFYKPRNNPHKLFIMKLNSNFKLHQSQGALVQQCQSMANVMDRDLSMFNRFQITTETVETFRADTMAYHNILDDSMFRAKTEELVYAKNQKRIALNDQVQYLLYRVAVMHGKDSAMYHYFGSTFYYRVKEKDMVSKCKNLAKAVYENMSNLEACDIHPPDLDKLLELTKEYDDLLQTIVTGKSVRKQARVDRLEKGIALKQRLLKYAEIGKLIWRKTSPSKFSDYVLAF